MKILEPYIRKPYLGENGSHDMPFVKFKKMSAKSSSCTYTSIMLIGSWLCVLNMALIVLKEHLLLNFVYLQYGQFENEIEKEN